MWGEDSEQSSPAFCRTDGRRGWWERIRGVRGGDERVGQLRSTISGPLCMYWSTTRRGKKKEKEDFSALFCCSAAVCRLKRVWELSSWATHHTRDEHIQFCGESALPGSTLRYFQQLPVVELRFRGCFMWSGGSSGSRWSTYQVLCVWRPAAREYLRTFERRRVFKHVLKSENNIKKGKRRSRRFKGKCWVFWRNHQFGMLKTKIPRSQESWCGALGDESWEGAREGWGGKNGLPLPCGTSNRLHRCLPMSMQVLQIVKELVSPSRRRAVARFGGVCR